MRVAAGDSGERGNAMTVFGLAEERRADCAVLNRLDLTRRLVALLEGDEAVIGELATPSMTSLPQGAVAQLLHAGQHGAIGLDWLGVALAEPQRQVIALEGDGPLLMNLGCLATIAQVAPPT